MASNLSADKQVAVTSSLAEGSSIRSIGLTTAVHRDTIMRPGVRVEASGAAIVLEFKSLEQTEEN